MTQLLAKCAALTCIAVAAETRAESWPASLNAGVTASPAELPTRLDPEAAVWSIKLPGPGASAPAVTSDRWFVTCEIEGENGVIAITPDGAELWRAKLGPVDPSKHRNATSANSSPIADEQHVYVYFRDTTLAALDHDGRTVWSFRLADRFGPGVLWWDRGSSPVLSSRGVVVAVQEEGNSYVATFDRETGETIWRTPRDYERPQESDQSYTTPAVVSVDGVETVVTWGSDYLTGHAAETGELLWQSGGFNPKDEAMWRSIASAAVTDSVAVVPYGRGDWLGCVRLGGSGDITASNRLWDVRDAGSDVPTPLIVGDRVYVLRDKGEFLCLDLNTGQRVWADRLPRSRAKVFASPVLVGDRLYVIREDGSAVVCRVDEGLEVLSETELGDIVVATPVVVGDDLVVRTRDRLIRFSRSPRVSRSSSANGPR